MKKRDLQNVTCYGCGKRGRVKVKCQDGEKEEKIGKKDSKSNAAKEEASKSKISSGMLYPAVSHSLLASTRGSTNTSYVNPRASYHLNPSRGDSNAYQKFATPIEIPVANGGNLHLWFCDPASGKVSQWSRTTR